MEYLNKRLCWKTGYILLHSCPPLHLNSLTALVNRPKLVPGCVWLLRGALEIPRLRLFQSLLRFWIICIKSLEILQWRLWYM